MRLNTIDTIILEVCKSPEYVKDYCFGSGRVQGGKNLA